MASIDNPGYMHHDELDAEIEVAPAQVAAYKASGWLEGPLPSAQAERDAVAAQRVAEARAHAQVTAERQAADAAELAAAEHGTTPAVDAVTETEPAPPAPPIAGRNRGGETAPTGQTTPTPHEEG